jgi:hypothetical protein
MTKTKTNELVAKLAVAIAAAAEAGIMPSRIEDSYSGDLFDTQEREWLDAKYPDGEPWDYRYSEEYEAACKDWGKTWTIEVTVWESAEQFIEQVKAIKTLTKKVTKGEQWNQMTVTGWYQGVKFKATDATGKLCERVQVGTKTVTKPDPTQLEAINAARAAVPTIEVEEPVYEMHCPPSLLNMAFNDNEESNA